jgi:hypothetical protein
VSASGAYSALTKTQVEDAFKVYQHAQTTSLKLLLVGRWVQESTEKEPGIDQPIKQNFLEMNQIDNGGSVLNSKAWTPLMNDAWVLGGLHSTIDFYLASPRTEKNLKGTSSQHPMTVTAREIIGITHFGYQIIMGHPSLGEVARCASSDTAKGATFPGYAKALQSAVDSGALKSDILKQLTAPAKVLSKL